MQKLQKDTTLTSVVISAFRIMDSKVLSLLSWGSAGMMMLAREAEKQSEFQNMI